MLSTSTHVKQIPESILLSVQLPLFCLSSWDTDNRSYVSTSCCLLRISEYMFGDICRHLHAVLAYEASFEPLSSIDPRIDLAQPCYDQGQWFYSDKSIIFSVFIVNCVSTTHLSMILSAIPLALVPFVSFIANSLNTWSNIIMHQAMLLRAQVCISPLVSAPELTRYPRACVGTGHR